MFWDNEYERNQRVWGEGPGELAVAAVSYLQKCRSNDETLSILDIGCGYGRDAFYFLGNIKCKVMGIDISERAIDIASAAVLETQKEDVKFQCCGFSELSAGEYDIVFVSNFYQLLRGNEREELRKTIGKSLKRKGLLFLSTLSINDPQHHGKGAPVPGESNSFHDKVYIHLCTREELIGDFVFLNVRELYEHEYYEPRATDEIHHHISWMLIGELR